MKTIKKKKYRFRGFIDCSVEVNCIFSVIILEDMFGNMESTVFTYGGIRGVELACFQMLSISLRKIFICLLYLRLERS